MMMQTVMLAEESEGCLSMLLEWEFWVAMTILAVAAAVAWDILKILSSILAPARPRLRFKVRVRRRAGKPKRGA